MKEYKISKLFEKSTKKLKGQELMALVAKMDEICSCTHLDHYKNLKYELKKFKRVHVNNAYVILFFGEDDIIYFVDYEHHDIIYRHDKETLKKYNHIDFN